MALNNLWSVETKMSKKPAKPKKQVVWKIDIKTPCEKRGINNAFQLWLKIGGSKATTAQLFNGSSKMIRLETINKLYSELGILPTEIFVKED